VACGAQDGHCITCSDEGVAMRVVRVGPGEAMCAGEGSELHAVAVELVGPVSPGDHVLVHAGVAIHHLGRTR
jgi:hydrogenase maturation factor